MMIVIEEDNYLERMIVRNKLINEGKEFFRSFLYDNHLLQPNLKYLEDKRENFDSTFLLAELIKLDFENFPYSKLGRLQIMMGFFSQKDLNIYKNYLNTTTSYKSFLENVIFDPESFNYKNDPKQGKIDYETEKKRIRTENEKIEEYNLKLKCQLEFLRDNILPELYPNPDISIKGLECHKCEMTDTENSMVELFITETIQNNENVFSTIRREGTCVYFYYDKSVVDEKLKQELEKIDSKKNKQLYQLAKLTISERIDVYYHKYLVMNDKLLNLVKSKNNKVKS